jgi:ABC-type branched-subunit amino acid transport system ATPase component
VEQHVVTAMEISDYLIDQGRIVAQTTPVDLPADWELRQEYFDV